MKISTRYNTLLWTDGVVTTFATEIYAPAAPLVKQFLNDQQSGYGTVVFEATTNGQVWSYALRPTALASNYERRFTPGDYVDRKSNTAKTIYIKSLASLLPSDRPPFEWAVKDMARRAKLDAGHPDALQINVIYDRPAPQEVGTALPGPCGPIHYLKYPAKVGAYTLEQVHATVVKAVETAIGTWTWRSAGTPPWKPTGLHVIRHDGKTALGLAYAPGTGRDTNKRIISLNSRLFTHFDLQATWRVVIHELCHHYRDEVFHSNDVDPETSQKIHQAILQKARNTKQIMQLFNSHDPTFIRELSRVDPVVENDPYSGVYFTEYADQSLVAEVQAKKAARTLAQEAAISWDPSAGRLFIRLLKSREASMSWIPLDPGRWKPPVWKLNRGYLFLLAKKLGTLTADHQIELTSPGAQARVTYDAGWARSRSTPDTFAGFIQLLVRLGILYPSLRPLP